MATDDTPTFAAAQADASPAPSTHQSPLDALRAEAKQSVQLDSLDLSVPARLGWGMRFDPNVIDGDKMQHWSKKAVGGNRKQRRSRGEVDLTEVDQLKFARTVLRATHTAFLWQHHDGDEWQVVMSEEDAERPLALSDEDFLDMVGAATADEALRMWYGSDGHILQVASEIIDEAGFGEGDVNPLMAQ